MKKLSAYAIEKLSEEDREEYFSKLEDFESDEKLEAEVNRIGEAAWNGDDL